ncbi:MAG: TonB-dependent receptor, partial [Gammaproteobacteria bacterium]
FANLSSGYKTPSLYQLFSEYGNKELEPETSLNVEAGAQVFTKDGKGNLRATYFNRRVKDAIAFFYNATTFQSYYINQDQQKDYGIELDGSLNLTDNIQLRAFYSYVDGKITTKQGGKDTTYFNLLRRPKSTVNIFLGTQVTKALYASVNLNSVGERADVYFDPVTFAAKPIKLKTYTLVRNITDISQCRNKPCFHAWCSPRVTSTAGRCYRSAVANHRTPGDAGNAGLRNHCTKPTSPVKRSRFYTWHLW